MAPQNRLVLDHFHNHSDVQPRERLLTLLLGGRPYLFRGGPYAARDADALCVCMLPKAPSDGLPTDVHVPTPDFDVPSMEDLREGVAIAWEHAVAGHDVYVGCGWGRGRTGLFLAALASLSDECYLRGRDPVSLVRERYLRKAVETDEQAALARAFPTRRARWALRLAQILARLAQRLRLRQTLPQGAAAVTR